MHSPFVHFDLNDCASNPMAHSVWLSSRQRGNDTQYPTVVSHMACCVHSAVDAYSQRVQRGKQTSDVSHELLAAKPCSTMPVITYCGRRSVADKWKPHRSSFCGFPWTLPDTESRSVAGHKAHSLAPLTPPFMDQKVVLRVLSLTRTLFLETLFGNLITCFRQAACRERKRESQPCLSHSRVKCSVQDNLRTDCACLIRVTTYTAHVCHTPHCRLHRLWFPAPGSPLLRRGVAVGVSLDFIFGRNGTVIATVMLP